MITSRKGNTEINIWQVCAREETDSVGHLSDKYDRGAAEDYLYLS